MHLPAASQPWSIHGINLCIYGSWNCSQEQGVRRVLCALLEPLGLFPAHSRSAECALIPVTIAFDSQMNHKRPLNVIAKSRPYGCLVNSWTVLADSERDVGERGAGS